MESLTDMYGKNEELKQKAAALDAMMKKREVVDAYNKGGKDAISSRAADMYANDLAQGLAAQQMNQVAEDAYLRDNMPVAEAAPSGVDPRGLSYETAKRMGLVK